MKCKAKRCGAPRVVNPNRGGRPERARWAKARSFEAGEVDFGDVDRTWVVTFGDPKGWEWHVNVLSSRPNRPKKNYVELDFYTEYKTHQNTLE